MPVYYYQHTTLTPCTHTTKIAKIPVGHITLITVPLRISLSVPSGVLPYFRSIWFSYSKKKCHLFCMPVRLCLIVFEWIKIIIIIQKVFQPIVASLQASQAMHITNIGSRYSMHLLSWFYFVRFPWFGGKLCAENEGRRNLVERRMINPRNRFPWYPFFVNIFERS